MSVNHSDVEPYNKPLYIGPNIQPIGALIKPQNVKSRTSERLMTQLMNKKPVLPMDKLPILALDPGGTTGFSLMVLPAARGLWDGSFENIIRSRVSWDHGEIDCYSEEYACHQVIELACVYPSAAVVVEDFILRSNRQEKSRDLLSPVRLTAVLKFALWQESRIMFTQQAGQAKTSITDERLRIWRCYEREGGLQHARDADRHLLLFIRRLMGAQGQKLRSAAWPHIYPKEKVHA